MKIALKFLHLATLIVLLFPSSAKAQSTQNFSFETFDANYYLQKEADGSSAMSVNETLVAMFPSYNQNHGILRAIPETYNGHKLRIEGISLTQDAKPAKYTTYNQNDNLVLKIGDPGTYVSGRIVYKINYKLHDVMNFVPDHDELFWDINGDQWPQTFGSVVARIHIPRDLAGSMQDRQRCYAGSYGSTSSNCSITRINSGSEVMVVASADAVGASQTLSAVLAFNKGTFQLSPQAKKEILYKRLYLIFNIGAAAILPISAAIFMFGRWRKFGDDPKGRGVIIPEYEPPNGLGVLESDFLLKQKLRNEAVSALLIGMAVSRHIDIYEIPKKGMFGHKDYELELHSYPDDISAEAKEAVDSFFNANGSVGKKVKLSEVKKEASGSMRLYNAMKNAEKSLAQSMFEKKYFIKNPIKVRTGYRIWALVAIFIAPVFLFIGFMWGVFLGVFLSSIMVLLFSFIMPARTESGVAAHDALLGLKDYIKLAEADRLKFLQNPEGAEKIPVADQFDPKTPEAKVKLFEKLLPYAMLFGLEKDWAKQFEGVYATPPSWYHGDWSTFNAIYLASSISDFGAVSSQSFSSPSSSSGSGFSGGGAGGGGGGGGGGGW